MAGGEAHIDEHEGRHLCHSRHLHAKAHLLEVQASLQAGPTELIEFHCALVRNDVREQLGPFDEGLMSMCEHLDFCMQVSAAGAQLWFEPQAVVSYDISSRFEDYDRPYFALRWSDSWTGQTLSHFREKWRLYNDDPYLTRSYNWCTRHRQLANASRFPWPLRVASVHIRNTLGKLKHGFRS